MLMSARWILFPFFFAAWAWGNSFVVSLSPQRELRKQTQAHSAPTLPLFEPSGKSPKYFSNRRHTTVSRKTCGATTPFFPHLYTINSAQAPPSPARPPLRREGRRDERTRLRDPLFLHFRVFFFPVSAFQSIYYPTSPPSLHSSFSASAEGIFTMSAFPPPTPAYVRRSLSFSTSPTNQPTPQLKKNWNFAEYTSAGFFCPRHKPEPFLQKKTLLGLCTKEQEKGEDAKIDAPFSCFLPFFFHRPRDCFPVIKEVK